MPFSLPFRLAAALTLLLAQGAFGQEAQTKAAPVRKQGLPPRATPGDYQAHTQAGAVTIAAESAGHSIPTPEALFTADDYIAVEVGLFGQPGARLQLSYQDFSLRINGKKSPSPAQPYELVFKSVKDPNWAPPEKVESKSKTSIGSGAGAGQSDSTPAPVHIPIEVERAMDQRVQKAALPEGERVLPEAGLIFFQHRGKISSIRSMELIYNGPAGTATLALRP